MTSQESRPTPADPMPSARTVGGAPSGMERDLPPVLGPDAVGILEASTFMFSNAAGDVPPRSIGGLVHYDTRYLSRWQLTINGAPPLVLSSCIVDHYSAAFFLANPELPGPAANTIGIRRQRFVGDGLHERIELRCFGREPKSFELRLAVGNDFADLFEIKTTVRDRSDRISRSHSADGSELMFVYSNGAFQASTEVHAHRQPTVSTVTIWCGT
ncbi:glycogen debranching N-terminal domain-containing protein [Plantactinospora soyae]|uniref:Glycogen debranching enzyme n=1 Tax=Plantactinospora soyae TaxID=1544732 RepID=A0A927MAH8_9ACTN|nr:glycogen debranching N-terminal domain-containing protein [Plantactinospora soyae]MBE1490987.1 glycogen debranching enzyme [Plantactinospora soyae]